MSPMSRVMPAHRKAAVPDHEHEQMQTDRQRPDRGDDLDLRRLHRLSRLCGRPGHRPRRRQRFALSQQGDLSVLSDGGPRAREPSGAQAGAYNSFSGEGTSPGCITTGCTAAQLAQNDFYEWSTEAAAVLPSGAEPRSARPARKPSVTEAATSTPSRCRGPKKAPPTASSRRSGHERAATTGAWAWWSCWSGWPSACSSFR